LSHLNILRIGTVGSYTTCTSSCIISIISNLIFSCSILVFLERSIVIQHYSMCPNMLPEVVSKQGRGVDGRCVDSIVKGYPVSSCCLCDVVSYLGQAPGYSQT